jgi:hypothetical protein
MLSSTAFAACFALLLASWVAAAHAGRQGRPAPRPVIVVASLAPALLVAGVVTAAAAGFGDLRVALEGLRFRLRPGDPQTLRIGGSAAQDHLVVRDLPAGFLTFRSAAGGIEVDLAPGPAVEGQTEDGFDRPVAAVRLDGTRPFFNSVPLPPGATVDMADGERLRFDGDLRAFARAGRADPANYLRTAARTSSFVFDRFQVPIGRELKAEAAPNPLRYYAAAGAGERRPAGGGPPLGSFLCRDSGLLHRDFFLVLTGPEMQVERPGKTPAAFQPIVATIPDGGSAHLALFRLDYHDPRDPDTVRPSRAQERRSLVAKYRQGVLDLILDTPDTIRLPRAQIDGLRRLASQEKTPMLLTLAVEGVEPGPARGQMLLRFAAIGAPLGTEMFSRIEPPERGTDLRVTTHSGAKRYQLGDGFPVGEDAAVLLRITRLDLPWGTLLLVFVVSAAAVLAGVERRGRALELILLSGVEMLLALRLLIAYQGATLDTAAAGAIWESLAVLVVVPFILQAALDLYERRGRPAAATVAHGLLATACMAAVLSQVRDLRTVSWLALLLPLAAPVLLGRLFLPLLDRLPLDRTGSESRRGAAWLIGGACGLILLRLAMLLVLGWKERMTLGFPMAVSLYYTPWTLLIFALLWGRRERAGAFLWLWGLLGILDLAIPALAHDWGTAFIFSLPVLLLFALPLAERSTWRAWWLAMPLLVTIVFHTLLPLIPALHLSPRVAGWQAGDLERARTDPAAAAALLERKTATSQNALRVWNLAAPEQLREVGTTEAEGQLIVMENLRDYASQGPLGAGYLRAPLSPPLTATQLDDNLSAIHLLGTFGWLGTLLLLLLLVAWSVAPFATRELPQAGPEGGITPRAACGLMLVWTLLAAGMYMLSANTALLLFTGKNVYFLAAASLSDAAEGTLLVVLALWAFAAAPAAAATP